MRTQRTNIEYGQKVRAIIKASGDTLLLAADKIGISMSALSYILAGRNRFRLENLIRFCELYNASLDDLYFNQGSYSEIFDFDVLALIWEAIETWEEKNTRISLRDKMIVAHTYYENIKNDPIPSKIALVTNLLDTLMSMNRVQKSA